MHTQTSSIHFLSPYSFQGQEHDDEVKGDGNSVNYKYRMHDPRIGRFFAVDPLDSKYPYNSPYSFSENVVINAIELEGLEKLEVYVGGSLSYRDGDKTVQTDIAIVASYDLNTQLIEVVVLVGNNIDNPSTGIKFSYNFANGQNTTEVSNNSTLPAKYVLPEYDSPGSALTELADYFQVISGISEAIVNEPSFKDILKQFNISESYIEGTIRGFSNSLEVLNEAGYLGYGMSAYETSDEIKSIPSLLGEDELVMYDGGTQFCITTLPDTKCKTETPSGDYRFTLDKMTIFYTDQTQRQPALVPNYVPTTNDQDTHNPNNYRDDYIKDTNPPRF
jgi:RHS repeat-associated protein